MAKVDMDLIKFVLQRNELDVRTVAQIMDDIQVELTNQVDDEEKPPPVKKQFVMMVSDPEGELEGKNYTGWILQIPEEDSPFVAEERIIRSAYEYNASKRGRRMPVKSIGEACEAVPLRFQKEQNVWIKTKEPVLIVRSSNELPDGMGEFDDLKIGGSIKKPTKAQEEADFVRTPIDVNEVSVGGSDEVVSDVVDLADHVEEAAQTVDHVEEAAPETTTNDAAPQDSTTFKSTDDAAEVGNEDVKQEEGVF